MGSKKSWETPRRINQVKSPPTNRVAIKTLNDEVLTPSFGATALIASGVGMAQTPWENRN
jgi:hypothetical protein